MGKMKRTIQGDKGILRNDDVGTGRPRRARTAGTDRDFDETREAQNQGHGHPREERGRSEDTGRSEDAGRSQRTLTETDRRQRDLGGPGGGARR